MPLKTTCIGTPLALAILICTATSAAPAADATASAAAAKPARTHGINLAGGNGGYDNACLIFADLIRGAGSFNGYRGKAPVPAYDAAGWPTMVDKTTGSTSLILGYNASLPAGDYTLTGKGKGKFQLSGGFDGQNWRQVTLDGSGAAQVLKLPADKAGVPYGGTLQIDVIASDPADPIRDLSFVLPGHVGQTFYRPYVENLTPFSTFRTMDWQSTNGSKLVEWADREAARVKFSVAQRGRVDEEYAIELANLIDKDVWICIPVLASDDYIRRLAELFDGGLEPERGIYVEYSNELWGTFPQAGQLLVEQKKRPQFPTEVPAKPGVPAEPLGGGWEYAARRDGHATNLFKASLSSERRCVRVIARQAGYPGTITVAMAQYKADGYGFDAISAACYFYSRADIGKAKALFATDKAAALAMIFDGMPANIAEFAGYLTWYKTQADANHVPLLCYEGGQHLGLGNGDDSATAMLMAVNRDPRMGQAYRAMMDAMPSPIGICWFNDCGPYSKWGYWGLKERTGQANAKAPKYAAVLADIAAQATVTAPAAAP